MLRFWFPCVTNPNAAPDTWPITALNRPRACHDPLTNRSQILRLGPDIVPPRIVIKRALTALITRRNRFRYDVTFLAVYNITQKTVKMAAVPDWMLRSVLLMRWSLCPLAAYLMSWHRSLTVLCSLLRPAHVCIMVSASGYHWGHFLEAVVSHEQSDAWYRRHPCMRR